ncbi:hypothetical protein N9B46_03170 [Mariniblastus sp.]|nr:hypothetical protein [Mariniblastus sp.]
MTAVLYRGVIQLLGVSNMNLFGELSKYDGKRIGSLHTLAQHLLTGDGSVDELIVLSCSEDTRIQTATTWVLKYLHEQNISFSQKQTNELIQLACKNHHWEAKLHILQILPKLKISSQECDYLRNCFRDQKNSENKLVRTWTYNGLAVLANQHSQFQSEVNDILNEAQHDPAASVRARIRKICKSLSWVNLNE